MKEKHQQVREDSALRTGFRKVREMSTKKKAGSVIVLATAVAALFHFAGGGAGRAQAAQEYTEYAVERGSISASISGSGTVEPVNQYEVVAGVRGEVLSDTFDEGDSVSEGDVLYVIDSSDVEDSIERAGLSYERSLLTYEDSQKAYTGLSVTAGTSGRVAELFVEKGDSVQAGSAVAKIVNDSQMTVRVPFSESDAQGLSVGQEAIVTIENTFETISGTIASIASSLRTESGYLTVRDVEVSFENPGYLKEGTYASVSVKGLLCQQTAAVEYESAKTIKADAAGTVEKILAPEGSQVSAGDILVQLENEDAADGLRSSQLTLREAELSYQSTAKQLEDYTIAAPISGSIIEKTIKAGDTIDGADSQMTMAIIADMSQFKFTIYVDELDISQLSEGQAVNITCDALEQLQVRGVVDNIGINGSTSNGVTSYPVRIVFDAVDGILPGMNVTADIITDEAQDALLIPSYAVNRGNTVTLADGSEVPVELGLSDGNRIEIVSGLHEGDVIRVPSVIGGDSASDGFAAGGMPGGGMPGGGMSGSPAGMPSGGSPAGASFNRGGSGGGPSGF